MRSPGFFQLEKNKQLHSFGNPFPLGDPHPQAMCDYPISIYHPDVLREEREDKRCNEMPVTWQTETILFKRGLCFKCVLII